MRWNQLQNPDCGFVCAALFFPEKCLINSLLILPEFLETLWSFKHALTFLGKVSGMCPV